jgi:hypothetical protein
MEANVVAQECKGVLQIEKTMGETFAAADCVSAGEPL